MKKIIILTMTLMLVFSLLPANTHETITADDVLETLEDSPEEFKQKAWQAYQKQEYQKSIDYYLQYVNRNITDGSSLYNIACCYGLLGNAELAAKFLSYAYEHGFKDVNHIKNDPDFEKVRDSETFQNTFEEIQTRHENQQKNKPKLVYIENSALEECLISLPENYDQKNEYDLVIALHGYGDKADNFLNVVNSTERDSLIICVPYAPYTFSIGDEIGYSWYLWTKDDKIAKKSGRNTEEYLLKIIDYIQNNYSIDSVYLFGFSQGAFLSFNMALHNGDSIDGIIPFGGGFEELPSSQAVSKIPKELKFFIVHGKKDDMVEFDRSEKAVKLLQENDFNVKFIPFDGTHHIPQDILQQAFDWIE